MSNRFKDFDPYKSDVSEIKWYLKTVFSKKKTKKNFKVYENLVILETRYTDLIRDIIDDIPRLGYWKDCNFLILASKKYQNKGLENYIINSLVDTIDEDIEKKNNGKKITKLAKWLPREASSFNKKTKFILTFVDILIKKRNANIPNHRSSKMKYYRKIKTELNEYLGNHEGIIANKDFENIDFEKIGPACLKNNHDLFIQNDISRERLEKYYYDRYIQLNLWDFIRKVYNKDRQVYNDFMKDMFIKVWKDNIQNGKYYEDVAFVTKRGINFENDILIINLCDEMFHYLRVITIYSIYLLFNSDNTYVIEDDKIVKVNITNKDNIFDMIADLSLYMCNDNNISSFTPEFLEKINGRKVLMFTYDYNPIENYNNTLYWTLNKENRQKLSRKNNVLMCNPGNRKIKKYDTYKIISNIINTSKELKDTQKEKDEYYNFMMNKIKYMFFLLIAMIFLMLMIYDTINN